MKNKLLIIALVGMIGTAQPVFAEGTAEKTGKEVDQAIEDTKDRAKEIGDNVRDGDPLLHKKGTLEKMGENLDDVTKGSRETPEGTFEKAGKAVHETFDGK